MSSLRLHFFFFFFNDTATTEIYTLSLHDALPILAGELECDEAFTTADGVRRVRTVFQVWRRGEADRVLERRPDRHADFDIDRKSTRLNSSHSQISYAVFCLKKKNTSVHLNYHITS